MSGEGRLMSVDARLVKDVLVRELLRRAEAKEQQGSGAGLGNPMAVLGYCTRLAEAELFEPARAPAPGLAEQLGQGSAPELARKLADAEPAERPDPSDGAPSWTVPGPGGHVRHFVAMQAHEKRAPGSDPAESKRAFMYGFFVRCCEEVA